MLRFTHFFKWYTDQGLTSNSRVDLERPLFEKFFFRVSPDASWYEDDDGWFINLNFSLSQILSNKRVINYELNNHFRTNPTSRLEEVSFRIRSRQKIWRQWLFYEIAPQVAFRRESDFETIYGILFELEAFVGWFEK